MLLCRLCVLLHLTDRSGVFFPDSFKCGRTVCGFGQPLLTEQTCQLVQQIGDRLGLALFLRGERACHAALAAFFLDHCSVIA